MLRNSVAGLVLASTFALPAGAQPTGHPATITGDAAAPLPRIAQAARVHLLGVVELYSLALYSDAPTVDRALLVSPDAPKALRIEIRFKDDLRRQVAVDWRSELIPRLIPLALEHLSQTFAPLTRGDVVLIDYLPGRGTTLRVNKTVVVTGANHDLMAAFLDHWLGQRPVSEEIKRTLLGSS
jgi:hypothetical protein